MTHDEDHEMRLGVQAAYPDHFVPCPACSGLPVPCPFCADTRLVSIATANAAAVEAVA